MAPRPQIHAYITNKHHLSPTSPLELRHTSLTCPMDVLSFVNLAQLLTKEEGERSGMREIRSLVLAIMDLSFTYQEDA